MIGRLLGHRNPQSTSCYGHLYDEYVLVNVSAIARSVSAKWHAGMAKVGAWGTPAKSRDTNYEDAAPLSPRLIRHGDLPCPKEDRSADGGWPICRATGNRQKPSLT